MAIWKAHEKVWFGNRDTIDCKDSELAGVGSLICIADNYNFCTGCVPCPHAQVKMPDSTNATDRDIETALAIADVFANLGLFPICWVCRAGQSRSASFAAVQLLALRLADTKEAAFSMVVAARPDANVPSALTSKILSIAANRGVFFLRAKESDTGD